MLCHKQPFLRRHLISATLKSRELTSSEELNHSYSRKDFLDAQRKLPINSPANKLGREKDALHTQEPNLDHILQGGLGSEAGSQNVTNDSVFTESWLVPSGCLTFHLK